MPVSNEVVHEVMMSCLTAMRSCICDEVIPVSSEVMHVEMKSCMSGMRSCICDGHTCQQ